MGRVQPFVKWLGSKQRVAQTICNHLPKKFGCYYEPFVGSGAILGQLSPSRAVAGDALKPLIELWQWLQLEPDSLYEAYRARYALLAPCKGPEAYLAMRSRYNQAPNPADLLVLSRSCFGGVIRFDKNGLMNTPKGSHRLLPPELFWDRCIAWRPRIANTKFVHGDFAATLATASAGDLVFLDPPYPNAQRTLYGSFHFRLERLWDCVEDLKRRGVSVALSLDATKASGTFVSRTVVPAELFPSSVPLQQGRSMLKRFQRAGGDVGDELVTDRLWLSWSDATGVQEPE